MRASVRLCLYKTAWYREMVSKFNDFFKECNKQGGCIRNMRILKSLRGRLTFDMQCEGIGYIAY
jgi:hypothetical protein